MEALGKLLFITKIVHVSVLLWLSNFALRFVQGSQPWRFVRSRPQKGKCHTQLFEH